MGLDVYLYKYENHEEAKALEKKYDEESEKIWGGYKNYDSMTEDEKKEASKRCEELREKMGLGQYGEHPGKEEIKIPSKKHPGHMFKIGYVRSSYNGGGINHILRNAVGKDLYDIFGADDNASEFQPDWKETKKRARKVLDEYCAKVADQGMLKVLTVSNRDKVVTSEEEAIKIYEDELKRYKSEALNFDAYMNKSGEFSHKNPYQVVGIIPGKDSIRDDCTYVIYKSDSEDAQWYKEALEIIIEMCDWVLKKKDIEKYWIHWSA